MIWRDGLASGEGGPWPIQQALPPMAQFGDDDKRNNGSKLTRDHREEDGRVMDREKGTNEATNVTVGDHTELERTGIAPSVITRYYIAPYLL